MSNVVPATSLPVHKTPAVFSVETVWWSDINGGMIDMLINPQTMLTPEQFAAKFRGDIKVDTVQRYCHRGMIKAEKIGSSWLIYPEELEDFRKRRRGPGRPPSQ